MNFGIEIVDVQQIKSLKFNFDFERKSIICITGKNGCGKTTLIKSVKNLISSDTFYKTNSSRSLGESSRIIYGLDENKVIFGFNRKSKTMDSRDSIPRDLRNSFFVELPIPHGERFNFFQKISEIDRDIRHHVVLKKYSQPSQLIDFLESVYSTRKFFNLVEVIIKNSPYYALVYDDGYYLREDYFSSGEYFLINLYKRVKSGYRFVFIDEIDISLDAAAQVKLIFWLNKFNNLYGTKFVFTTHSLAMMKTISSDNLYCMEVVGDGSTVIENRSYAYIKSTLFGFYGCDRYILTEDEVLKDFLEFYISKCFGDTFYKYKIIYVGGGTNTTDLMSRNISEKFFSEDPSNVIVILDGDQKDKKHAKLDNVFCVPFDSVEKDFLCRCLHREFGDFNEIELIIPDHIRLLNFIDRKNKPKKKNYLLIVMYRISLFFKKTPELRDQLSAAKGEPITEKKYNRDGKKLYDVMVKEKNCKRGIFDFLMKKNEAGLSDLKMKLNSFLSRPT
ncbi:AAA family ATPase [Undibacterium luofuense]|uniref:AAA family ATPase n=1 Tax=Undibacterium luofuense TaxID=2828733 RepID=A0A941DP55_9BURK|nr:AAA family ATPase [Undibacterium luofuense]MBR7783127.1 AAA family ATPase [Undibacterium luofuense]